MKKNKEIVEKKKKAVSSKRSGSLFVGEIVLTLIAMFIFANLPTVIANKISYKQLIKKDF